MSNKIQKALSGQEVLVQMDKAKQAIEKATKIEEAKEIVDRAETLRTYAKQNDRSIEIQNYCAEIRIRAEHKSGELLREMDKKGERIGEKGGRPKKPRPEDGVSSLFTLKDLGISEKKSRRWQMVSLIPKPELEEHIEEIKSGHEELTTQAVLDSDKVKHMKKRSGKEQKELELQDLAKRMVGNMNKLKFDFREFRVLEKKKILDDGEILNILNRLEFDTAYLTSLREYHLYWETRSQERQRCLEEKKEQISNEENNL